MVRNTNLIKLIQAKKQTYYWMWFGRVSPLLFLLGAIGFYEIVHTEIPLIFYMSWAGFLTVSLIWWGWVLKIILDFIEFFSVVESTVNEIKTDVNSVVKEVKALTDYSANTIDKDK